jgi:predicted GNAT family acetyltransferase
MARHCRLSEKALRRELSSFIENYGDIPPDEVVKATAELNEWFTLCDDDDNIISAGRYEDNDWYLCTFKNIATHPDHRREGLGGEVVDALLKKTFDNPNCLVLASDITHDNIGSKRIFKKRGFEEVTRFCWGEGEEPADIMHLVKFPAGGTDCPVGPPPTPSFMEAVEE